jgi:antirestriction protein
MSAPAEHKTPEPSYAPDSPMPRIYVASLSDYNAGRLHGRWINANQTAAELEVEINDMLGDSPEVRLGYIPEEWAIHDYEGFGPLSIGEHEDLETIADLVEALNDHGEAYLAYADHVGLECASPADFMDVYCGVWSSMADYAQELAEDIASSREEALLMSEGSWPFSCIDWERAGRELEMGGDNYTVETGDGNVYIFRAS